MKVSTPEELGFSSERLTRINKYMERYVNAGKAAGFVTLVARRGEIVYFDKFGYQNAETKTPMALDSIFRIYSMTKPITSVAFMMLFERGLVRLEDPVTKFIPEFKDLKILGPHGQLEPIQREITLHMLLTHTAGLCYAEWESPVLGKYYIDADIWSPKRTLKEFVHKITTLPHVYHPDEKWHYSMATDVIGHVIEIVADMPIADYFEEEIIKPLGMSDTAFHVPRGKEPRFAELYGPKDDDPLAVISEKEGGEYANPVAHFPGHGLVSTAEDYFRFSQMVLNKGEFNGIRLLAPRTIEYMTLDHLRPDLLPMVMEAPWFGMGFGLGFSVVKDPALAETMSSPGTHGWGGAASTNFWIDPLKEIIGILLLQLWPSYTYPTTNDFRTAVYQALIE
jgi:CubicO group peptidase (beta-lactamase class C family)